MVWRTGCIGLAAVIPVLREDFVTDNGDVILDVHGLEIMGPMKFEQQLTGIVGIVTNGLFAHPPADIMILGSKSGPKLIEPWDNNRGQTTVFWF